MLNDICLGLYLYKKEGWVFLVFLKIVVVLVKLKLSKNSFDN